jgi:hypothetical protein
MTDKELLELAAKAAGLNLKPMEIKNVSEIGDDRFIGYMTAPEEWVRGWFNPLTDDADAFRLAVKLHLIVGAYGSYTSVFQTSAPVPSEEVVCWHGIDNLDPYAATRRAIVRAAAEIGRRME